MKNEDRQQPTPENHAESPLFLGLMASVLQGTMEDVLLYAVKNRIALGSQNAETFAGRMELDITEPAYAQLKEGGTPLFESINELRNDGSLFRVSALDVAIARRFSLEDLQNLLDAGYLPGAGAAAFIAEIEAKIGQSPLSDREKKSMQLDYQVFAARAELKAEQVREYDAGQKPGKKAGWREWFIAKK